MVNGLKLFYLFWPAMNEQMLRAMLSFPLFSVLLYVPTFFITINQSIIEINKRPILKIVRLFDSVLPCRIVLFFFIGPAYILSSLLFSFR